MAFARQYKINVNRRHSRRVILAVELNRSASLLFCSPLFVNG